MSWSKDLFVCIAFYKHYLKEMKFQKILYKFAENIVPGNHKIALNEKNYEKIPSICNFKFM